MSKPRQQGPHGTPEFIDILSSEDRKLYEELQQNVGSPDYRYNRNRRLSTLRDILDYIRDYCERDDIDAWKRYLVCGICWMKDCIAINTRQLRLLISKSKSAINGAFAKMGYVTVPTKGIEESLLLDAIPFLSGHYPELRQWTIRKMNSSSNEKQDAIEESEIHKQKEIMRKSKKKELELEMKKTDPIGDSEFDLYEEPFKAYGWPDDYEKEDPEKDISFINFGNDTNDAFYDFDYNFNPNVFTLTVNQYSFPNEYEIIQQIKSLEDEYSREDCSKGF